MSGWYVQVVEWLQISLLEWKFFQGGAGQRIAAPAASVSKMEETPGTYEEVEEVCLRRGRRSRRLVRRLVQEG